MAERPDWASQEGAPDWAKAAPTKPKTPTFFEAMQPEAFTTGTVRGALGGLGELEKFGAYTIPQFVGGMVGEPGYGKMPKEGRATLFPTTEEVGKGMEALGIEQKPGAMGTAGEVFGGLGTAIPGLVRGGKALAQRLAETKPVRMLRGKETAAAQERLGREAAGVGATAQRAIEAQSAAETARLARSAETRAAAERAGQREARKGESALRELAGVRTIPEAGAFRPIPAGKTEVGDVVRREADKFVTSIKQARNAKADELFGQASGQARAYASVGQFADTRPVIAEIDRLIAKGGTEDYLNSLRRLRSDLDRTKNFEGLEVIRRKLGDAAFGAPEEGYKAISQQFAGDMRDLLTKQMRDFSKTIGGKDAEGAFGRYLDEYKRLSENLRVYGTKTGRGILETEGAGGRYFAKTGEQIADEMFKSPEAYRKFVEAVGNNKQITEAAARRYFAGILEGKTKPTDVEKVLKDFRSVLNEMPTVRTEIEGRYLAPLRQTAARGEAAESIIKGTQELDKQIAAQLKNVEGSKTIVSDAVKALTNAKPGKTVETFEGTVLPKIRDAEARSGTRLFSDQQIEALRRQVAEVDRIADRTQKARIIAGILGTYFVGQTAASGAGKIGSM